MLYLKADVLKNTLTKKIKEKKLLVGILKATEEKRKIRIRNPVYGIRIRGSGSVSKPYESGTLQGTFLLFDRCAFNLWLC